MAAIIERMEVPPPLEDDVVVTVRLKDGRTLESPLLPGVIADTHRHRIELRRDRELNYDVHPIPEWLPDDFDFAEIAEVGVEYRGSV